VTRKGEQGWKGQHSLGGNDLKNAHFATGNKEVGNTVSIHTTI
jgi:hypothetical protein